MLELRTITAEGDAFTRGETIGRSLGDEIDRCVAFHRTRFAELGLPVRDLPRVLTPYRDATIDGLSDLVAQVEGMAIGAEVDFWELFALNALEELDPLLEAPHAHLPERCSTITVSTGETTLLGHNEQWYAGDGGSAALVVERPTDGRSACISPTIACYLPAVGMNAHGTAQGIDSLVADDDRLGIPRVFLSRHSLDAADRADAIRRAGVEGRAGGYAHVLAFRGGDALSIETTATRLAVVDGPGIHTNHYLDPALATDAPAPSAGSTGRYERLAALVAARPPRTVEDVMGLLADHEATPDAVCLHPVPADDPEASAVLFSMVCDVGAGRMWVAPGNPCSVPYQEVDLSDVH
ncbi:MAG: C45 family peptidase [Gaiellales bacterium]